jgi:hypothetical protein
MVVAVLRHWPSVLPSLNWYHDECRSFADIREWVLTARQLAVADFEQQQP